MLFASAADAINVVQVTDNDTLDGSPAISGSNVVWVQCDDATHWPCQNGDYEIYFWDGSIPIVPINITDDDTDDMSPDISGSNVVWQSWDGNDSEIFFWDGSFPIVPIRITNNTRADGAPHISGSNVVWQQCDVGDDARCESGDTEIQFWDGSFPINLIQITNNGFDDRNAAISGSKVVWEGVEDNVPPVTTIDVYFWDGSFPITPIPLTDNDTLDWRPDISNSTVVWVGWLDGQQGILRWDGSFPVVPSAVSVGIGGPFLPAISGSHVVWQQDPGLLGARDIYFWNGVETINVSNDGGSRDEYADISGSTVVWDGCWWDSYFGCLDDEEIYVATVPAAVPSISSGGLALLAGLVLGSAVWLIRRQ
jgi:hypothetical protein